MQNRADAPMHRCIGASVHHPPSVPLRGRALLAAPLWAVLSPRHLDGRRRCVLPTVAGGTGCLEGRLYTIRDDRRDNTVTAELVGLFSGELPQSVEASASWRGFV